MSATGFYDDMPQSAIESRLGQLVFGNEFGQSPMTSNMNQSSFLPQGTVHPPASAIGSYGLFTGRHPVPIGVSTDSAPKSFGSRAAATAPQTPRTANSMTHALLSPITALSKQDYTFPARPDVGVKGRRIRVRANFFELISIPGKNLYHYDIKITPEIPPSLNRRVFKELMLKYGETELGGSIAVYDGRRNLYTPIPIKGIEGENVCEFDVSLSDDTPASSKGSVFNSSNHSSGSLSTNSRRFSVRIKECPAIDMNVLKNFVSSIIPTHSPPFDALQALDVLMRHRPSMLLTSVGRSFFTRNDVRSLGDGAECWMGFHQSVRPAQGKLVVNIDVSATAFFEPGQILNFIARTLGRKAPTDLNYPLKNREIDKCEKLLKGIKVQINHRGDIKRKYKINGITKTMASQTFFLFTNSANAEKPSEGVEISVVDYFLRQYNIGLKFPHLPCLKVGSAQRTVYLPLEVCDIVEGQRFLRKLNENQTAQMIRLTCQTPDRRANKISSSIPELGLHTFNQPANPSGQPLIFDPEDESYLKTFGVQLSNEMMTIPARVLEPPTIQYHPSSREPIITPREGSWNLRDKKVVQPSVLQSWAMVCFGTPREMPQQKIDQFLRELIHTCRDTGLIISNAHPPALYGDPNGNVEATLQAAWQAAGESTQSYPQLILCVLPNAGVPLYAEIKRVADTVLGIATQCVQVKHTFQPKKQYCANVCLKINSKLGGVNSFIVKNPQNSLDNGLPWISEAPTILFGADVTHPAHGESRAVGSVCALVASLDRTASRYAATVRLQPARRDIIQELSAMVQELLMIFYQENNQISPQRIVFYRDGISESQFLDVVTNEITAIREACERIQVGYRPKITYMVVQKRHHARLFTMNPKDADKSGNIPPGTIIDSHITHPNEFDFYLCSHSGLQGTSRPTHYHVLHDENKLTPDVMQELTYRLCYSYARCTRSVSVVPPAYYADLVAFRTKYHLKSGMSGNNQGTGGSSSNRDDSSVASAGLKNDPAMSAADKAILDLKIMKEDEEFLKQVYTRLAKVKPDLQRVMYFM